MNIKSEKQPIRNTLPSAASPSSLSGDSVYYYLFNVSAWKSTRGRIVTLIFFIGFCNRQSQHNNVIVNTQGDHFPDHMKFPDFSLTTRGKQRLPGIECLPIWSTVVVSY